MAKKSKPLDPDGVHAGHCCLRHGCKYGDKDCPVASGQVKQHGPCMDCDHNATEKDWQREPDPDAKPVNPAEVSISRTHSNHEPEYITLRLATVERRLEVKLTLEQLALIITGRGGVCGELLYDRQNKTKKETK